MPATSHHSKTALPIIAGRAVFDFADNAKLKESGFALDGKVINIDSTKSLNSVVGHEITHVLEGTEVYDALKQTLFDYAKSKGDYQGRYDSLTELYKNVKGADIEAELAADLVGDYLFTDADFIKNLSTKHRNVFQKIYDEIKYLHKIATAGSREARELEKVKKAFEKAYKEQKNTADGGVKYSIYSRPNFNQSEWSIVNRRKHSEFNNPAFDLDTDRKWMYANEKGSTVFAIYSKHDAEDPTVLYGSSGRKADQDYAKLNRFFEEGQRYAGNNRATFDRILNDIKSAQRSASNGIPSAGGRGTTTGDVFLPFRESGSNGKGDFRDGGQNSESLTNKYNEEASDNSGASFVTFSNDYATIRNFMKDGDTEGGKSTADTKYSLGEIVDENQHSYGIGVHLDSTLLDNLTPNERLGMVKEYVKELGGESFTAYDPNGKAVDITIAKSSAKFKNRNRKRVAVNKDLTTKNISNEVKQETIALIDELIVAAEFDGSKAPQYAHGWLDSNGQNDWEYWTTYVQDKNNTIWKATLNVANTANGEKVLYDICPIKKVGRSVKSDTIPTDDNISQKDPDVKVEFSPSDSDGRQLSKEQQEYFKDSKVRDENGSLKVMYHGTPNGDFTVFKDGSYFTDNKEYADRYQNPSASSISSGKAATAPKTFEVYLDIKKPFDINDAEARNIYINDYIKGGNAIGINPYLSDAEYDKIKTIDWTEGEDLRDFLIENGYDGLVLDEGADGGYGDEVKSRGTSYVVFSPEQIKAITNQKTTDTPDINRSLSAEGEKHPVYGNYNVSGKDIALEIAPVAANVAPVQETVSKKETVAPIDALSGIRTLSQLKKVNAAKGQPIVGSPDVNTEQNKRERALCIV